MTTINEISNVYDHERKALADIRRVLLAKHAFRGVMTIDQESAIQRTFSREAAERCAEIGLVVDVLWEWTDENTGETSPDVSDDISDRNLYWKPRIVIVGRTDKLAEFDHDRQKAEVRSGLLDGKVGEIREGGEFREDFKRKSY